MPRKKPWDTCELKGLAGRRGATTAAYPTSVADAMAALQQFDAIAQAGCDGAIAIWRNPRTGQMHGEFRRYGVLMDRFNVVGLMPVRNWLRVYWPEMGDRTKVASGR